MNRRARVVAALVTAAVHVALLAPLADGYSVIVGPVFQPQAEAILDGALPYEERGFEYPPLALPLLLAPGLVSDGVATYVEAFSWEMIGFDLAIVALLALGLRARRPAWQRRSSATARASSCSAAPWRRTPRSTRRFRWGASTSFPPRSCSPRFSPARPDARPPGQRCSRSAQR